ncbi:hypothetical protein BJY16_005271 [Actinoplanes octamycinicus]|uniref:Uncharacterized protein n=1 Tax=Actinoplanes octamycinicus TaxID=135948 RepID=A0A7W7M9D0_9ACTN|nr:hypothetical protein [Actinoplanes octamycinicus]MBB4741812.1 hypothetical protein [Actinoplanes octamycinicus]GIE57370.1 hypothetical protein Aoc01nite_27720 [Actinoplanes octamycinicus]
MMMHPDMMLTLAHDRRDALIAAADRERLLRRLVRRVGKASAVRGQPTSTLASCERSAAVPAQ